MYQNGEGGVSKDNARAMRLYLRACESKDARASAAGCTNAGEMHRDGLSVPKDRAKAIEFYRRGCAGAQKEACAELVKLGDKP